VLMCSPTGSGKTVTFVDMVKTCILGGGRAMIVVNRKELLSQAYDKAVDYGLLPTKIDPKYTNERNNCYIASIDTLRNRVKPEVDLIIIDECHFGAFKKVHEWYSNTFIIGATATPISTRNHILSEYYDAMVQTTSIHDLIQQGYLLPARTFGVKMDTSKIKIKAGDFDEREMFGAFNKTKLYDGVIENYHKFSPNNKCLVFNCSVQHSRNMAEVFKSNGMESYSVDSKTPKQERGELIEAYKKGEFPVLNNCSILTTGYDDPSISSIIFNRATLSEILFLQMCGRGSRPFEGLDGFNIIDQGGNVFRFGFWEDKRNFSLDLKARKRSDKMGVAPVIDCPGCGRILFASVRLCSFCGHEFPRLEKELEVAEFEEIKNSPKWQGMTVLEMNKRQMKLYAKKEGLDDAWVDEQVKIKRKFEISSFNNVFR